MKKLKLARHSIMFDNRKEFVKHQELKKNLGADIYFAKPYKSCKRDLNEHTKGLFGQVLPKKLDFCF